MIQAGTADSAASPTKPRSEGQRRRRASRIRHRAPQARAADEAPVPAALDDHAELSLQTAAAVASFVPKVEQVRVPLPVYGPQILAS